MSRIYYTKTNFSEDLREVQKFADFAIVNSNEKGIFPIPFKNFYISFRYS